MKFVLMEILEKMIENIKKGKSSRFQLRESDFTETERTVEIPWALSKYKNQKRILDIGTTFFDVEYFRYFIELLNLGVEEFHSIDIIPFRPQRFEKVASKDLLNRIIFKKGDIRQSGYPNNYFDLVICISVMEHIGFDKENLNPKEDTALDRPIEKPELQNQKEWSEDFIVVREILRILKVGGSLLLTVPFGKKGVAWVKDSKKRYALLFQFDYDRLQDLFNKFKNVEVEDRYFFFDENMGWKECETRNDARIFQIAFKSGEKNYALGVACIEIKKLR